jgi:putative ABC transport system permease protein
MFFLQLVFRNAFRARLRTWLTILGLVIALTAFGLLQTVVKAWYAGVEAASSTRLITRNAISLVFTVPVYYREQIRPIEGVRGVSVSSWFGGIWRDEKSFFAQFAVDAPSFFPMYPEFRFDPDQYSSPTCTASRSATGCRSAARSTPAPGSSPSARSSTAPTRP